MNNQLNIFTDSVSQDYILRIYTLYRELIKLRIDYRLIQKSVELRTSFSKLIKKITNLLC